MALTKVKNSVTSFTQDGTGAVERGMEDKLREVVSVKDFGADPANTAEQNTTAFQAAVDSGAKHILIPAGVYLINSIDVSNSRGLTIEGEGHGELGQTDGTAYLKLASNVSMFVIAGDNVSVTRIGITFKHIHFDGDASNLAGGTCFDISQLARRIYIQYCYVAAFRDYGLKAVNVGGIFIHQTDIFNCGVDIYGDTMADSGVTGGQTGSGAGLGAPWITENIHLTGFSGNTNFIEHRPNFGYKRGVRISGNVTRVSFIGGYCDQNLEGGFLLEDNCTAINIIGMQIFDNGTTAAKKPAIQITTTQIGAGFQKNGGIQIIGNSIFDRETGTASERQDIGIDMSTLSMTNAAKITIANNNFNGQSVPISTLTGVAASKANINNNVGIKTQLSGTVSGVAIGSTGVKAGTIDVSALTDSLHTDSRVLLTLSNPTNTDFVATVMAIRSTLTTFDYRLNVITASSNAAATVSLDWYVIN